MLAVWSFPEFTIRNRSSARMTGVSRQVSFVVAGAAKIKEMQAALGILGSADRYALVVAREAD